LQIKAFIVEGCGTRRARSRAPAAASGFSHHKEDIMRRLIGTLLLAFSLPLLASAQATGWYGGQGYAFFAPGVTSPGGTGTVHLGGGGEVMVYRGLGLGAELGYLAPWRSFSDGLGVFSPNVSYHLLPAAGDGKVEPFVTGGYTLLFRSGTVNGFNFGGGINYWLKEHVGLRFEVRDNVGVDGATTHFVGFRVGVAFR
jgi:hypothetical protein